MKVYIRTGSIRFIMPIPLVFLKFGVAMVNSSFIKRNIPERHRKYIEIIDFKQLSKCIGLLKEYRGLEILEVRAKDGTKVSITL
ncbi:hypothetical protein ACSVC9_05120 [Clostridium sp. LBM24168]